MLRTCVPQCYHWRDMNIAEFNLSRDLDRILKEETPQALPLDLWFCYRLLLLRRPEFSDPERFVARASVEDVRGLVASFLKSEEFQRLWKTVGMQLPDVPVMVVTPEGTRIWFSLADCDVGWRVAAGGYEPDVAQLIKQSVGPGSVCCDLGANIGYFSLLMAKAGATVYAFEPFPKNFGLLSRNIHENELDSRISAHQSAVLDRMGDFTIASIPGDSTGPFVVASPELATGYHTDVIRAVRLDDVIPEKVHVTHIKMDIEGAEPLALEGMQKILERDHPTIFFEFAPAAIERTTGRDPATLIAAFHDLGYRIRQLNGQPWEYDGRYTLKNLVANHEVAA